MKLAVLTGGSQGLGLELLSILEAKGWTVLEISRTGTSTHHLTCDLGDPAALAALLPALEARLKSFAPTEFLFVNNAGILTPIAPLASCDPSEISRSVAVNVEAPLKLFSLLLRFYRNASIPKTILNISSGAAHKGYAGWTLYCTGKAALYNACLAIRAEEEYQAHPFRIINVNPFVMDTAMQAQIREADPAAFPARPRFEKFKDDQVLLSPQTVAKALIALVQDPTYTAELFDVKAWLSAQP